MCWLYRSLGKFHRFVFSSKEHTLEVGLEGMKEERSIEWAPSQKRDECVEVPSVWLPQTVLNPLLLSLFPGGSGIATLSLSHAPLKLRVAS